MADKNDEHGYGAPVDDDGVGHPTNDGVVGDEPRGAILHVRTFSESKEFNIFIFVVIIIAGISIGIQTNPALTNNPGFVAIDNIILSIFIIEAIIKIVALCPTPWRYFLDSWNVFDFTIVMIGIIDLMVESGGENVIVVTRLFRLLRILKVVKFIPQLRIIVTTMFASLPSIGYISVLLLLLFYIYGVMGVLMFEKNDPRYFGDLGEAMLTLFRVMTCDSWAEILYINMNGCEKEYSAMDKSQCKDSQGLGFIAVLYFISFVILVSFIVLNLFIAVVTANMTSANEEVGAEEEQNSYTDAGLEPPEDPDIARHKELVQLLHELEDKVEEQARDIMDLQERVDAKC
jgi:voltage-gated sodium channel